jgi:hypothetical protein
MGWVFQILAELEPHNAQAADVRSRIRGVIFDSSPADVTAGERVTGVVLQLCSRHVRIRGAVDAEALAAAPAFFVLCL